jgi:hypothetical protein
LGVRCDFVGYRRAVEFSCRREVLEILRKPARQKGALLALSALHEFRSLATQSSPEVRKMVLKNTNIRFYHSYPLLDFLCPTKF